MKFKISKTSTDSVHLMRMRSHQ